MKPYQSDFLERVKQAVKTGENSMLVYRKQGYESKAFRLQLRQLADTFDGVLLEDRHAFTYVVQEYSKIGLYSYKESHELIDKFNRIKEGICAEFGVPVAGFRELCQADPNGLKYMLFMCSYFLKVNESYVLTQVGAILFQDDISS
jgi:hypothetical protein